MKGRLLSLIVFATCLCCFVGPSWGQQVYVSTPVVNVSDSFYEWFGIDWGFQSRGRHGNFFFNRGSSLGTIPRFGGYDPSAAARLGFSSQGSNHGFFFNLTAAQGSNRTITSSTPSVTVANGAVGSVRDVQMRPFVTGLIPVVGSSSGRRVAPPTLISPLADRLARLRAEQARQTPAAAAAAMAKPNGAAAKPKAAADPPGLVLGPAKRPAGLTLVARTGDTASTAERGDISVAEIRRRQETDEQAQADELERLVEEAKAAESVGRFGAARVRYRQAAARAGGDRQRALLEKLESIRDR